VKGHSVKDQSHCVSSACTAYQIPDDLSPCEVVHVMMADGSALEAAGGSNLRLMLFSSSTSLS
jgi:hypothetical protein